MQIITEIFSTIPGTTSAYAENTCLGSRGLVGLRNYLRVRGEYFGHGHMPALGAELPPRTRRILKANQKRWRPLGTTSAYAENTQLRMRGTTSVRNYLRVRGEYAVDTNHS